MQPISQGLIMRTTEEILHVLGQYKPYAIDRYGIVGLGLFGSAARNEQTEDSDVDIFYQGKALSLLTLDSLQSELEELLGCQVDIVRMRDSMNPLLRSRIEKEGLYA